MSTRPGLDAAGEVQEHLAGVEDYILAEAVWREAIARWPGATIILRQGARVVRDSRRPRVVEWLERLAPLKSHREGRSAIARSIGVREIGPVACQSARLGKFAPFVDRGQFVAHRQRHDLLAPAEEERMPP
jgi:hypothetical protein